MNLINAKITCTKADSSSKLGFSLIAGTNLSGVAVDSGNSVLLPSTESFLDLAKIQMEAASYSETRGTLKKSQQFVIRKRLLSELSKEVEVKS